MPESGELVEGLESRVYVRAAFPNGEPADVAASIVPRSFSWPGGAGMHEEPSVEAAANAIR